MNDILRRDPRRRVRVFAVWEPILPTDWRTPGSLVRSRLSDLRVVQFWDSQHWVSKRMAKDAREPQPKEHCCVRNGNLWDLAAVYPAGTVWNGLMPPAVFFDGPVVKKQDGISNALGAGK